MFPAVLVAVSVGHPALSQIYKLLLIALTLYPVVVKVRSPPLSSVRSAYTELVLPRRSCDTLFAVETLSEPYTDELFWDWNPLAMVSPPFATIFPFAKMSLLTERLPVVSEWIIAEVDSIPPRSRMEMELALLFATYA